MTKDFKHFARPEIGQKVPPELLEEFEERAAILELDGKISRAAAEAQAIEEIKKRIYDKG